MNAAGELFFGEFSAGLENSVFCLLFAVYFIWFLLLFTNGIRVAHSPPKWQAFLLAFIGLLAYRRVFLIFNRQEGKMSRFLIGGHQAARVTGHF